MGKLDLSQETEESIENRKDSNAPMLHTEALLAQFNEVDRDRIRKFFIQYSDKEDDKKLPAKKPKKALASKKKKRNAGMDHALILPIKMEVQHAWRKVFATATAPLYSRKDGAKGSSFAKKIEYVRHDVYWSLNSRKYFKGAKD